MTIFDLKESSSLDGTYSDTSPFLNWDEHKSQTALETTVLFRSLIATMKFQPSLDDSLEAKAVKFLNSVPTRTQASADSFLTSLVSYSDDLSTDFVQPFMVLISSPNLGLTAAATKMLGNLLFHCSAKFTFTLVKEELIPQLMVTLNPLSLSFEEAVYIHANLMKTITNPVKLATPIGLAILRIKQYSEQQAVYETVFRQVLAPSEQYIRYLCENHFSIFDGRQSKEFLILLAQLLQICSYHQRTMDFVLSMPVILTIASCLTFFENDQTTLYFLSSMAISQRQWNEQGGEEEQMGKIVHQMLRMEGIEDVVEQKLQNDKNTTIGKWTVDKSIEWNNQHGINLPRL